MATVNGKQKAKPVVPTSGVFKVDSVKDIAESLGITNLPDAAAYALAHDVEYRLQQVIEEASRFTRHARRGTMTTQDVDLALRVLNIEPLYGHSGTRPPAFRRAPGPNPVYFVEDEEIDFDRILREDKVFLPKGVTYTAHWLAVEGVQPLIPENPPAVVREPPEEAKTDATPQPNAPGAPNATAFPPTPPSPTRASNLLANKKGVNGKAPPMVKQVLSRELQLYYTRLTSSLLPPASDNTKRTAALGSLRHDAGLQPLLPYLIRWVGEGVIGCLKNDSPSEMEGKVLEVLMEVLGAIISNQSLFVEPHLHQILPPLLSTLLTSTLPPNYSTHLRTLASQTISRLLTLYSTTYSTLSPRIMKTLLIALLSTGKNAGSREGAVRGLIGVGKEAVRKGLVEGGGMKALGIECSQGNSVELAGAVRDALAVLQPPSASPVPLDPSSESDSLLAGRLQDTLGDYFGSQLLGDRERALAILNGTPS
ncbi:TAF-domain-containing protein [Sistotremastrum niveocremeum HHB9708]|uniref:TAF-domain-containing protein n=1 Tax=Sistotremastrum niveocremeum HHB9708 TaxID=1314777 RepID=A0A164RAT3_9AGAM|nr:TAF-domain-containing protein [Sistotremastrum niveocremeum HHB9708]